MINSNYSKNTSYNDSISLKCYFKELKKVKLLNGPEQVELVKLAKEGDSSALDKLVKSNLRFVFSVAKEYQYSKLPLEDLINEGNIGLIKAVQKFDESKGYKFISYAVWWVRQSIIQAIYETGTIVRLPINRININNKINKVKEELSKNLDRDPTFEEISEIINIGEKELSDTYMAYTSEQSIEAGATSESGLTFKDTLVNNSFEEIEEEMNKQAMCDEIDNVLSNLTTRENKIINMYFGLGGHKEMTLKEIGKELDLTNERVRQVKEFALRKLRIYNKSTKLKEFLNYK